MDQSYKSLFLRQYEARGLSCLFGELGTQLSVYWLCFGCGYLVPKTEVQRDNPKNLKGELKILHL